MGSPIFYGKVQNYVQGARLGLTPFTTLGEDNLNRASCSDLILSIDISNVSYEIYSKQYMSEFTRSRQKNPLICEDTHIQKEQKLNYIRSLYKTTEARG